MIPAFIVIPCVLLLGSLTVLFFSVYTRRRKRLNCKYNNLLCSAEREEYNRTKAAFLEEKKRTKEILK